MQIEYADPQTKVSYTWVTNVVFVTHSTLGYPRAVLSLEQGLTFLFIYNTIVLASCRTFQNVWFIC